MGFRLVLFKSPVADRQELRAELRAALESLLGIRFPEEPDDGDFPRGHYPTETDSEGRIVVPEGTAPRELSRAIRDHWPRALWGDVARLSWHESSWRPTATLDTRGRAGGRCGVRYWLDPPGIWASTEHSVGYMQINICAHGGDPNHWYDADNNLEKARELYEEAGRSFRPWAYNAGKLGLLE